MPQTTKTSTTITKTGSPGSRKDSQANSHNSGLNEPYLNPEPTESRFRYEGKWYVRDKAGNVILKDS